MKSCNEVQAMVERTNMGAEQEKTQAFQIGQRLASISPRALPCPFSYCHFHHCLLDKYIAVMESSNIKAFPHVTKREELAGVEISKP
jgi:hypothetical protein